MKNGAQDRNKDESQYQQVAGFLQVDGVAALEEIDLAKTPEITETDAFAGFLPVDGAAVLEEIDVAKTPEIAEADAFTGLYWMDSDTDDGYTDNRSDTDAKAAEEPKRARES